MSGVERYADGCPDCGMVQDCRPDCRTRTAPADPFMVACPVCHAGVDSFCLDARCKRDVPVHDERIAAAVQRDEDDAVRREEARIEDGQARWAETGSTRRW